jgi:hypothetical protein
VHIYDVFTDAKESLYIVMELCDYDLDHVLSKKNFFDGNKMYVLLGFICFVFENFFFPGVTLTFIVAN